MNLKKLREKLAEPRKQLNAAIKRELEKIASRVFGKFPELQSFGWTQFLEDNGETYGFPFEGDDIILNGWYLGARLYPKNQSDVENQKAEGICGAIIGSIQYAEITPNELQDIFGNDVLVTLHRNGEIEVK